jgi:hypothetical protein
MGSGNIQISGCGDSAAHRKHKFRTRGGSYRTRIKGHIDRVSADRGYINEAPTNIVIKIECVEVICRWGHRTRIIEVFAIILYSRIPTSLDDWALIEVLAGPGKELFSIIGLSRSLSVLD